MYISNVMLYYICEMKPKRLHTNLYDILILIYIIYSFIVQFSVYECDNMLNRTKSNNKIHSMNIFTHTLSFADQSFVLFNTNYVPHPANKNIDSRMMIIALPMITWHCFQRDALHAMSLFTTYASIFNFPKSLSLNARRHASFVYEYNEFLMIIFIYLYVALLLYY